MAEQAWFVVRTKQAKEITAACSIAAEGFHAFLPVQLVERSHAGKRERVSRPLFPRYLFVQFDRDVTPYRKAQLLPRRRLQGSDV
jgi:transcriptional antiterminator RfaH